MSRQAHQTNVPAATRGYMPGLLNPPYDVERTPEYQARVYTYAQNYFTPAEMQDLLRIGMRFVPQEAELIKRNLRRKGDFTGSDVHPSATGGALLDRATLENGLPPPAAFPGPPAAFPDLDPTGAARPIPDRNEAGYPASGAVRPANEIGSTVDAARPYAFYSAAGGARRARERSFLRRTELFIASMFVFDAAHALLAHLHQEAVSLTAHGVDADERLLKQIVRNIRGYTFRRLVRMNDAGTALPDGARPIQLARGVAGVPDTSGRNVIRMRDPVDIKLEITLAPLLPAVQADGVDLTTADFPEPFSTQELQQLKSQGWIRRDEQYWAPIRIPQTLALHVAAGPMQNDAMLRATNAGVLDPSRFMNIYPVAFLTNTTLADDAVCARLIEHCNSEHIDPMYFTWGMRRAVFMPLETDVVDIDLYSDVKTYDDLHETLNAFSNGLYEGLNIRGLWNGYLRDKLAGLVTQVPINQLQKFPNVIKKIEVPATSAAGGVRRTAGQEEVLRLWQKADDVLNLINRWFLMGGNFGDVTYDQYRNPQDTKSVMGNNAAITSWGARALGMNRCGPGYEEVWFDADPDTNPQANPQLPFLPDRSGQLTVQNPLARVAKCSPIGMMAGRIPDTGPDVYIDREAPAVGHQRRARRVKHGKTRKARR